MPTMYKEDCCCISSHQDSISINQWSPLTWCVTENYKNLPRFVNLTKRAHSVTRICYRLTVDCTSAWVMVNCEQVSSRFSANNSFAKNNTLLVNNQNLRMVLLKVIIVQKAIHILQLAIFYIQGVESGLRKRLETNSTSCYSARSFLYSLQINSPWN